MLLCASTSLWARNITVWVRRADDKEVGICVLNRVCNNGTWSTKSPYGAWNQQTATKQTLGGHTWYTTTYDLSKLATISGDYSDSYFSISFHNSDGSWRSDNTDGDVPGWGIKNNSDGVDRLPGNLYFVIDPNIIYNQKGNYGEHGWAGIHETTKLEILNEESNVNSGNVQYEYWLMNDKNERVVKFEPVRNQNQGLHTMSTSSYAATVWYDQIFPSNGTSSTYNFYVKAWKKTTFGTQQTQVQYDELPNDVFKREDYEYRPWSDTNLDPDPNGVTDSKSENFNNNDSPYFHSYGDCVVRVSKGTNSSNNYYFQLSKDYKGTDGKTPASYTILLNTGNYFGSDNDSRYGNKSIDKDGTLLINDATNNDHLPVRGIGVHPNKVLPTTPSSDKPMYIVSNMQQTNKDYYHNATVNPDNHDWTVDTSYPMQQVTSDQLTELIKQYPLLAKENTDKVWAATITKPGSAMNTIFMAFASSEDREALESAKNSSSEEEKIKAWNKVIRPFVAEGKDAISLFGGLYRPVNLQNGNQALSPGTDDMFYSQCQVYVNLTRSTYYVVPITGYDLTGPAIQYLNKVNENDPSTWKWEGNATGEQYWGNGETAYWATPMSYNKTLNCWEYTGKFFTSKSFAENDKDNSNFNVDKAEKEGKQWDNYTDADGKVRSDIMQQATNGFIGFRFLTNHLYTMNYREDYDRPTSTTHHSDRTAYWDGSSTDKTKHEDTYYYNHVDLDPNPNLSVNDYASAEVINSGDNANDEKIHNINFSLPDGTYTIRFYPNGDGKDNHPFYKISDALPNVPDVPRDDDNLRDYHFLRTFSSTTMRKLGENQQCFIVTAYDQSSHTATLTSLPYVPANTGVIIAAKTSSKDDLISTGKAKQLVDDIYEALNGYLTLDYVSPEDSITLVTKYKDTVDPLLKKNLLMPTTYYDEANKTTIEGGQVVKACTFNDGSTDFTTANANKVAYRNFNFSFYKKNSTQAKYTLGFYRIRNAADADAKTTAHHAWLRLPANISGGTTAESSLDYNIGSNYSETQSAKIFNSFVVDFPEWNNVTAIENVTKDVPTTVGNKVTDHYVYDLMGRRVARINGKLCHSVMLPKGIYIFNGKKFVVR